MALAAVASVSLVVGFVAILCASPDDPEDRD